ncbi:MAG: recombination mediator RecR [Actinomycetaceae bacterium]|nr:recombination mediator RecR [Actinomycetaceae bacterium]MDY6082294.1 recombination mediator RecR [Actinomycetaceae bacterium]
MASLYDGAVQNLIDELSRLPGIGPKSAQRIAFYILEESKDDAQALIEAVKAVKEHVHFCSICGNVTENDICSICADPRRSNNVICVVEEAKDIAAIEKTHEYRGKYHVLGGAINPIQGIGPDDLRIRSLLERIGNGSVHEVILATDPNIEGEATAAYISRLLTPFDIVVSRLASGLPMGGDLEYADEMTLSRAFEGRRRIQGNSQHAIIEPDQTAQRQHLA